jgi:KaiC/GvpD/RAD55 family RecA-like ATPase
VDTGRHIIARVLLDGDASPFIQAGLDEAWLGRDESAAVFTGQAARAWQFILRKLAENGRVPPAAYFRREFPEDGFRLPADPLLPAELIDLAAAGCRRVIIEMMQAAIQDILTRDDFTQGSRALTDQAADVVRDAAARLQYNAGARRILNLTDPADREAFFTARVERGAPFGIEAVDDDFYGIQPGQLVTLVGRQKSCKTFLALNSAVRAWQEGWDILFYTFEMGAEEIRDRIYAIGAHVNPEAVRRRDLTVAQRRKIEDFMTSLEEDVHGGGYNFRIAEDDGSFTVDRLHADISKYKPEMVYLDGFYFVVDRHAGKTAGADWIANENVARELKTAARQHKIGMLVTTQAQEKQHNQRVAGIEGRTMMGGTGLLRTSDLILGADIDRVTRVITLNCVMTRYAHVGTGKYCWDWDTMLLRGARDQDLQDDLREAGV